MEQVKRGLIEDLKKALNPLDEARVYKRLSESFLLPHKEIAKMAGKSRATVANAIRLLRLPENIQSMIVDKTLCVGHAKALLGLKRVGLITGLAQKISKDTLSVRKTEEIIRRLNQKEQHLSLENDQSLILELARSVSERLGTKVSIKRIGNGFLVEAHYAGLRELDHFLQILGVEL